MVKTLSVQVVYASETDSALIELETTATTIRQVIEQSGILERFPEIDLSRHRVGVFSELRSLDDTVADADRIEIYRSLKIDPKQARLQRAKNR